MLKESQLAPEPSLPSSLAGFKDYHAGDTIVVCGCGSSLSALTTPERFITIGVNDVGRLFQPDYLVILNGRYQFARDRFRYVEESRARALFTQLELGLRHPHVVKFQLGRRGGADVDNPNVLHYTRNSPYVAVLLALHMGARRIGLIGVDFTDHHFFGRTGQHPLTRELAQIDLEYKRLCAACEQRGVELLNLSAVSRLTALPRMSLEDFAAAGRPASALRIVSYSTTPVAGVPAILGRCIAARTKHECRTVWSSNSYGNGVSFQGDVEYARAASESVELLSAADVVIVHNGKVDRRHKAVLADKAVVTLAHNYLWNVDTQWVDGGFPGLVVGQYQAALPEFAGWTAVPNPLPAWEEALQPGPKAAPVTIAFTPSGKHERYPRDHRLYWHSKGYRTTLGVLDRLAARVPLRLEVIRGGQIPHSESLAMKRRAHIVIDECVTGSYHRNSLEGLAAGAVVVNGVGILPPVIEVLRQCAGCDTMPFVSASLDRLEDVLSGLVERGEDELLEMGRQGRAWIERYWSFSDQWDRFWMPAIDRALDRSGRVRLATRRLPPRPVLLQAAPPPRAAERREPLRRVPPAPAEPAAAVAALTAQGLHSLSVIIPHGGEERLRNLRMALQQLTQQGASDVIVIEMDEAPRARDLVTSAGFTYVFAEQRGPFHKARVMNMGIPFARRDVLLWLDTDLLFDADFLPRAVSELESRRLDCLVPWTSVRYLSEADSDAVAAGQRKMPECSPVNAYFTRLGARGGAVLVRPGFLARWGGQIEEFVGWGGEDNAFFLKAALLGRAGITQRNDQHIYHLYHPRSGGYGPSVAMSANPSYGRNLALLHEVRALHSCDRFVRRFPPPRTFPAPWHGVRRIACAEGAEEIGRALVELYGPAVELCRAGEPYDAVIHREGEEEPRLQALALAARAALPGPPAEVQTEQTAEGPILHTVLEAAKEGPMSVARTADLDLPEFVAFNHGRSYPVMRKWELPFALFQSRLSPGMSVLDCTLNPVDFRERLLSLYPSVHYQGWKPIQAGGFVLPPGPADQTVDRVICVNTLEHLLEPQRDLLIADLSRKLRPGGLLIVTCDYYFDWLWDRPEIQQMGVMRPDRQEIFNGWNKVTPGELIEVCAKNGLHLTSGPMVAPEETDRSLYRNIEPYPHACIAGVFHKAPSPALPPGKKIVLSLLTWNTGDISLDSLQAYCREAEMLRRLGHEPFIVVCDNGSMDGTQEAMRALDEQMEIPHRFIFNDGNRGNSIARNQVIDLTLEIGADYLLLMDGDIEIIPFSSHAMLRHLEESGPRLGCIGLDSFRHTTLRNRATRCLFSLAGLRLENTNLVAWTQYGLFRREVFEAGVRFDESDPFNREGWGFEDNDLAFQMHVRGYSNQRVFGLTYLHRHPQSSIRVMRSLGIDPNVGYARRKEYVIRKWAGTPEINNGPLDQVRRVNVRL